MTDEELAEAIMRGLPQTEECRRLRRSEVLLVVRSVHHKVPVKLPNVRPYVVGQMLALCMHLMGPLPPAPRPPTRPPGPRPPGSRPPGPKPVCKYFQQNMCAAGPCCKFDHLGLPDERELYRAMRWTCTSAARWRGI
jgi:hypothetical protein